MKVLITGAGGLLGRHLAREAAGRHQLAAFSRADLDITDDAAVQAALVRERPDVVANCAAMTGVDACETDIEAAFHHNARGPRTLAAACRAAGVALLHISTDYVFDGKKSDPYTPDDAPNPISVYGRSKLAGEDAIREMLAEHCIARVSGMYGLGGRNFGSALPDLLGKPGKLRAVADNRILPGFVVDVAVRLRELIEGRRFGTFHVTNSGTPVSWYDFARAAATVVPTTAELVPVTEAELKRPAPRPMNSALVCPRSASLGLAPLRDWNEALAAYCASVAAE